MSYVNLALAAYPVGSIYMSVSSTSPATLFGGTWQAIAPGRVLIGAGTGTDSNSSSKTFAGGDTGGEYNHTLTAAESGVPAHGHGNTLSIASDGSHTHLLANNNEGTYSNSGSQASNRQLGSWASGSTDLPYSLRGTTNPANAWKSGSGGSHTHGINGSVSNNTAAAASSAHNNMPPYLAVYMWKRTA